MTADELWSRIKATPFRPFTINVTDGRSVPVVDRWHAIVSPLGHTVIVATPDDSFDHIDMGLVVGVSEGLPAKSA